MTLESKLTTLSYDEACDIADLLLGLRGEVEEKLKFFQWRIKETKSEEVRQMWQAEYEKWVNLYEKIYYKKFNEEVNNGNC